MQKVLVSTAGPDLGSALNDLRPRLDALQSRLARDPIVTSLPPPAAVDILLDVDSVRFIVSWNESGVSVKNRSAGRIADCRR
jgi:hypothetical protein